MITWSSVLFFSFCSIMHSFSLSSLCRPGFHFLFEERWAWQPWAGDEIAHARSSMKRKWKRKSFVTVGKTWLIIKRKEPSKAWPHQRILLFFQSAMACNRRYDFLFIWKQVSFSFSFFFIVCAHKRSIFDWHTILKEKRRENERAKLASKWKEREVLKARPIP